ncbi:NADH-ubiquinone oxidoreductase complex I, 21 kDa subunit-domain-containing protein [Cladochytrium replicatum]|nr:NADH-ubiquinone oxidoreductase complex I, 21 kDa subunit-domain-containing protein [Cladochytrium replicatum]
MKVFSGLPDSDHVPYKFIAAEPHVKDVVRYFRTSDYAVWGAIGLGFPATELIWERMKPSIHPRLLGRLMWVSVPFYMSCGFIFAAQRTYFRFWGWSENSREAERWEKDAPIRETRNAGGRKGWMDLDW